jgi:hypothetical protein
MRGAFYINGTGTLREFDLSPSAVLPDVRLLRRSMEETHNRLLVTWSGKESRLWKGLLQRWGLESWPGHILNLRGLASRVLARSRVTILPEDLAADLELTPPDADQPAGKVRFLAACLSALLERVPQDQRGDWTTLQAWIQQGQYVPDFSRFAFGRDYLRQLPTTPGIYIMRNRAGDVIYVGKSRNLKRRVGSYFSARLGRDPKVTRILDQLHSLEVLPATSEVEALLLETRMIRDFRPPVNLQVEIHERSGGYGREQNLILLVAEPDAARVQLYLLKEGVFAGQQKTRLAHPAPRALREKLRSIYFGPPKRSRKPRNSWEREIVFRWLSVNRNRLNHSRPGEIRWNSLATGPPMAKSSVITASRQNDLYRQREFE